MAIAWLPKRRSANATAPTTADLVDGEVAINSASKTIYQRIGSSIIAVANYFGGTWADLTGTVPTFNQNTTGSAATLTTARTINGTAFNGSANISTANWGTARTITIGNTGKSVNGSANYSWSLAEIGADTKPVEVSVTTARTTVGKIGTTASGGYVPTYGDRINVTFSDGIAVASPTLNIDGSGAKNIRIGVTNVSTTYLSVAAATVVTIPMWYDGTYWQLFGSYVNSTYSAMSAAEMAAGTATSGRLIRSDYLNAWADAKYSPIGALPASGGTVTGAITSNSLITANSVTSKVTDGIWGLKLERAAGTARGGLMCNADDVTLACTGPTGSNWFPLILHNDGNLYYRDNIIMEGANGLAARTAGFAANYSATIDGGYLNKIVEKSNTTAYTFTLPPSLGVNRDAITFINSGTAGNITIARGSGVALYQNGVNGDVTVPPGSMVTLVLSATANRWIC